VKAWLWLRLLAGPLAAGVTIVVILSGAIPLYQTFTVALAAVYGLTILSLSLLAHWNGVWSIGHAAMLAIGAYTAAWGSGHGWSLEVTILFAMVVCGAFGAFLGFAGSRFSVLYVALLTLAFTLVTLEIINVWQEVTNGDQGVPVLQFSSVFGELFAADATALSIVVGVFGLALAAAEWMRRTPLRMRMVASKTHPLAARTIGIAPEAQSALGFALSAGVAGLAGVMLGLVSGFVSPESFSLVLAINLIAATVLGGTGSLIGAVVGGAFLAGAPTLASSLSIDQPYLVGGLLILALIFLPEGVVPTIAGLLDRLTGWSDRLRAGAIAGAAHAEAPEGTAAGTAAVDRPDPAAEPVLEVSGLGVRYGGLQAVQGIDMTVRPGEVVAIIGPNGAGKTTFVNALSGLTGGGKVEGRIFFVGSELRGRRATARRGLGLGRTFQHAELFDELTVMENVLAVNRRITGHARERAYALLDSVGLRQVAHRKPSELPFGLQKRADLARAIAENPKLLILDEPFGGLDADEREVLASHIRRVRAEGTSVVIIDHVLEDLFAVADRVVAFDFGEVIAEGTPATVMQEAAVRRSYLGVIDGEPKVKEVRAHGPAVITLAGVAHHYGGVQALQNVNLEVAAGSILGIVGANGAGKSTLGRILHGSLRPSSGTRREEQVDGRDRRISLVPEGRALFKTLSVRENLEVAAYAHGMRGATLRKRLDEMTDGLPERVRTRMDVSAGSLSGGEQQLVAIARALMGEPEILILDEPALGLSPVMVQEVYRQIDELAAKGITTVLLDQSLTRALQSCTDVAVLRQGELVARGHAGTPGFAEEAEIAYFGDEAMVSAVEEL
jgi:ABC-type multidrug transport system ATPase subunit/ABC-type branched-subunit amino acid transport system permease subunit